MRLLCIFSLVFFYLSFNEGAMVCYFSSWATYRQGDGKFDVEDIHPSLCTHLIYAFAGLNYNNEIKVFDPYNDLCENYGKCGYNRFTALKAMNPNLKTMLGVGGWNEGSTKYSEMAADPSKRKIFIDSTIVLLKAHNFDGLDLDWEYPTQRGGGPEDFADYVILLSELKTALHAEGMVLSAAVSAGKATIDPSYDVPVVAEQLDLINLMTYDLHGSWEHFTHHQSCLYAHPKDKGDTLYLNVDFAVTYWLEKGAPKEKLVMGIPLYGRTWRLDNQTDTGFYAPASRPGGAGPFTRLPGYLGYNEICSAQMTESWTVVHDPAMHEPYAYFLPSNNIWVCYEDPDSVAIKAQYALDKGLAGCMVWSVETDDFHGKCRGDPFPLLTTIVQVLSGGIYSKLPTIPSMSNTILDPEISTHFQTTLPPTPHCSQPGPNADKEDCIYYYMCSQDTQSWVERKEECPQDKIFNTEALICDWAEFVCHLAGHRCPNYCQEHLGNNLI